MILLSAVKVGSSSEAINVNINGANITTGGTSPGSNYNFGIQVFDGAELNLSGDVDIKTESQYGVGIFAQDSTVVTGSFTNIETSGQNAFGIDAERGAKVDLSGGTITINGKDTAGARAITGNLGTTPAEIKLTDVTINTDGDSALGVLAGGPDGKGANSPGVIIGNNLTITTEGAKSHGAEASGDGSSLTISNSDIFIKHDSGLNDSNLTTANAKLAVANRSHGIYISEGGNADLDKVSIHQDDAYGNGIYVTEGTVSGDNVNVYAKGDGLYSSGTLRNMGSAVYLDGSNSSAVFSNSNFIRSDGPNWTEVISVRGGSNLTINGGEVTNNSKDGNTHGIRVDGDNTKVSLKDGLKISVYGDGLRGTRPSGVHLEDASELTASNININTYGKFGNGLFINKKSKADIYSSSINTSNEYAIGGLAYGSKDINIKTIINLYDNSQLNINGNNSVGLVAQYAGAEIYAENSSVNTFGENSYGVVSYGSHDKDQSLIKLNNVDITTSGNNSYGVALNELIINPDDNQQQLAPTNRSIGIASKVDVKGGSINTSGNNSHAVYMYGITDNITATNLPQVVLSDTTIDTTKGNDSHGFYVLGSGDVDLTNVTANTSGATFVSDLNDDGQSQTIVANSSTLLENNGVLWQVNRDNADDAVASLGLHQGTVAQGDVIDNNEAGQENTLFTVGKSATWTGKTVGYVNLTALGNVHYTGDELNGDVTGQQGANIDFEDSVTVNGNVSGDGTNINFSKNPENNSKIVGDLNLDNGSETRGGDKTNPVQITGNANVNNSTLGGNLNIGGALSGSGMVLSPGNSIGVISVGSIASGTTGTLDFEINGVGNSDQLIINNGNFEADNFALELSQENGNGGYKLNHDYTIVKTENGDIQNEFNSVTDNVNAVLAKLDPVKYGQDTIKVSYSVDQAAVNSVKSKLTSNQRSTLGGVVSVAGANDSADATLKSNSISALSNRLDQLSGEIHASTQAALLNSADVLTNTISNRMRGNLGATMMPGAPTAQSSGAVAGSMPTSNSYPMWAQVVGDWSTIKGDDNTGKIRQDTAGIFVGGDVGVGSGWRLGGAVGYTDSNIKVNDRDSKSKVKSYLVGLYGGNSWQLESGKLNFLAGATYAHHKIDSTRHVNVAGSQKLDADYKANTTQLFTELGYEIPVGVSTTVEPYAGLTWTNLHSDSFKESGGSAALKGSSERNEMTTSTLGLRAKTTFESGNTQGTLMAGLGWRHAWGDVDPSRSMRFREGGGDSFGIKSAPIAKDAAVVNLGAEMGIGKNAALGLSYGGQFGKGNQDNTGSIYLRVRFN